MYKKSHIHFVGIGGIGMSGIAMILKNQGYIISGCDKDVEQKSVQDLQKIGCSIFQGNFTDECRESNFDILVYSSAIKPDNPELVFAKDRQVPIIGRALMLAEIMRTKFSIAISGAHGKTTTTSLISHVLLEAKMDPTVIIGGHLHSISSNAKLGKGDFLVAEADESDRSLLQLYPAIAIVTNIDLEHLETYKDIDDIKSTFKQFLENLPFYGKAIVCIDDQNIKSILPLTKTRTIKYGFDQEADITALDVKLDALSSTFYIENKINKQIIGPVNLNIPGKHNLLNALAAFAVCDELQVPTNEIVNAFEHFNGVDRRFTFKGFYQGAKVYDDYGHHPVEILNTLLVANRQQKKRLFVFFQPHRFIRTYKLWQNFVEIFAQSEIEDLFVTDIYSAGEAQIEGVNSFNLVEDIRKVSKRAKIHYIPFSNDFDQIEKILNKFIGQGDMLLTLGAGKTNKLAEYLVSKSEPQ